MKEKNIGGDFDEFLEEEGILDEVMKRIVKRKRVKKEGINYSKASLCHSCGKRKACSFEIIGNGELLDCPDFEKLSKHR